MLPRGKDSGSETARTTRVGFQYGMGRTSLSFAAGAASTVSFESSDRPVWFFGGLWNLVSAAL